MLPNDILAFVTYIHLSLLKIWINLGFREETNGNTRGFPMCRYQGNQERHHVHLKERDPREIAPEVVLMPSFIAALYELLDRWERRATIHATRPTEPYHTKEVTSRPHVVPLYAPPPQVFPLLASAATQGTWETMAPPRA